MPKRYCYKCMAEKVNADLIPTMTKFYGKANFKEDFRYNEKCDLCGEVADNVTAYPPMDQFLPENMKLTKKVAIDDKNAISKAVKPKEKVTLIFENGSIVQIDESNDQVEWNGVIGLIVENWLSIEEVRKLYPEVKIK